MNQYVQATELFSHYLKSNVQIGVADIFEIQALACGQSLTTQFHVAQIGLKEKFNWELLLASLKQANPRMEITTHVSTSKQSVDVYFYYKSSPGQGQQIYGISLVNVSFDKTRSTTICLSEKAQDIMPSFDHHIKDDQHPVFILQKTNDGINETRRSIQISTASLPNNSFYPFLGKSVGQYYDDFLASKSGILLLLGPAGTGKSTFLRGLILHSGNPASMVYDEDTIQSQAMLDHFYSSDNTLLGIEDADNFIGKREAGNRHLAGYLNYADGVLQDYTKKICISTNLGSLAKVDEALIRKGRCYDIIEFKELTPEQANQARASVGKAPYPFTEPVVLAEALSAQLNEELIGRKQSFGFSA